MICNKYNIEYHTNSCNKAFRRDLLHVFPSISINTPLSLVLTFQDAKSNFFDIKDFSIEKDKCLENFFEFSEELITLLPEWWCDYIDPSSGLPMKSEPAGFYSDIEACTRVFHFSQQNINGCFIIDHPRFHYSSYIASFYTTAPIDIVLANIERIN